MVIALKMVDNLKILKKKSFYLREFRYNLMKNYGWKVRWFFEIIIKGNNRLGTMKGNKFIVKDLNQTRVAKVSSCYLASFVTFII